MTQYNSVNIKLPNSQLDKLKSAIKNKTAVTSRLSSNMTYDSNDFPHKLFLTDRKVLKHHKSLINNLSTYIKLSKLQISNIVQFGGFLGRCLGPLLMADLPLMIS